MNSPAISERELRYRQRYNGKEVLTAFLFLLPLLVGIILFFIVPIVETFYYSFTRWKGIGKEQWIGINNYIKMFTRDTKFGMEVSNTFVYVLGSVPLTLIVAVIFAAMMNSKIRAVGFFRVHLLPAKRDDGHRSGDDLAAGC